MRYWLISDPTKGMWDSFYTLIFLSMAFNLLSILSYTVFIIIAASVNPEQI